MEQEVFKDFLIKFFEQEQWAKDFVNGNLYINQAGNFITEANNFRGDDSEGHQVTSFTNPILIQFTNIATGEHIKFPLPPRTPIKQNFVGANKVPIFCASKLDRNNLRKIDSNKFQLNSDYIAHMKQFGEYAVIFSRKEFLARVSLSLKEQDIYYIFGDVAYKEYDTEFKHFESNIEQYKQFLCKYISKEREYNRQNEWRLVLCNNELIHDTEDHLELSIVPLKYAIILPTKELTGIFTVYENDYE